MFKRLIVVIPLFVFLPLGLLAQTSGFDFPKEEKKLSEILDSIVREQDFAKKNELNKNFVDKLAVVLQNDKAFDYPFDSLQQVGKVRSLDNRVRIFTWNIPQPAGFQKYFGFVMLQTTTGNKVISLIDRRGDYKLPHSEQGSAEKWFGALYYDIIDFEHNGRNHYVLLGVDLHDIFSSKRILEVLSVSEDGSLGFGIPIFKVDRSIISRVIFEYSSRATMVLRWDKTHRTIVCSHLTPMQPSFAGNYRYYVPDLSFDGFRFNKPYWEFVPDIDIRNPSRKPAARIQAPTENYDPGFLYRAGR